MSPAEIRAYADRCAPRTRADGSINPTHVAIESTLRKRHGHPSFIADLDGPGRFIPVDDLRRMTIVEPGDTGPVDERWNTP